MRKKKVETDPLRTAGPVVSTKSEIIYTRGVDVDTFMALSKECHRKAAKVIEEFESMKNSKLAEEKRTHSLQMFWQILSAAKSINNAGMLLMEGVETDAITGEKTGKK